MRDLVPWPWIEPGPPALGAWSLNHWTTREVPSHHFLTFLTSHPFHPGIIVASNIHNLQDTCEQPEEILGHQHSPRSILETIGGEDLSSVFWWHQVEWCTWESLWHWLSITLQRQVIPQWLSKYIPKIKIIALFVHIAICTWNLNGTHSFSMSDRT